MLMSKVNRGIVPLILAIVVIVGLVVCIVVYIEVENIRNTQISMFKQFASDHSLSLTVGTVTYSNIVTLDLNSFEQKCLSLSEQPNFVVFDQHTHTWLVFPQEKFTFIDAAQNIAYQWVI
jgi:hypothetical protein